MELATLAGGCFWCLEAVFQRMKGVETVVSGYMGGHVNDPTYRQVCSGGTGHAEVVQISYDPAEIPFRVLLDVFFAIHDPTTLNRQGNDIGTQYRSAIFYHTPEQKDAALEAIASLASEFSDPIVTEVTAAEKFWPAEDYHQDYYNLHGSEPYCQFVAAPKVRKLLRSYPERVDPAKA